MCFLGGGPSCTIGCSASHSVADVALMPFMSASAAYRELPRWGMLDEKAIQQ